MSVTDEEEVWLRGMLTAMRHDNIYAAPAMADFVLHEWRGRFRKEYEKKKGGDEKK